MTIAEAMAVGGSRYDDALEELRRFGRSEFTQTGGMCAALQVTLERGYLLITDVDDSLPWDRGELRGWGVGFYWSDDVSEGPEHFVDTDDTSVHALGALVENCLAGAAAAMRTVSGPGGVTG
ncbi:hypothetical protein [Actinomycetospora flava]|uniref:Immunity protein Imm1 n=1 Tax=Actinomycetospora flava TaxID=3129232 RepID=A0ABU8MF80_9PSEU